MGMVPGRVLLTSLLRRSLLLRRLPSQQSTILLSTTLLPSRLQPSPSPHLPISTVPAKLFLPPSPNQKTYQTRKFSHCRKSRTQFREQSFTLRRCFYILYGMSLLLHGDGEEFHNVLEGMS